MSNVTRIVRDRRQAWQVVGRVVGRCPGDTWRVETDDGPWDARRATGCLLEPMIGDVVLALLHEQGCHVLCVLDRAGDGAKTLSVDGDLAIEARGGSIALAAHDGLDLVAAGRAHLTAGEVDVTAAQANVTLQRLTFLSDYVRAELGKAAVFASTLSTQMDRVVQRMKRSLRVVEDSEHVRARTLDYRAEDMVNVRGKTTLVTAEELVKLDGEQVHLG